MARYVKREGERIAWLLAHQDCWQGYGGPWDPRHRAIVQRMTRHGLFSERTNNPIDLWGLIVAARKHRRERAAGEPTISREELDEQDVCVRVA